MLFIYVFFGVIKCVLVGKRARKIWYLNTDNKYWISLIFALSLAFCFDRRLLLFAQMFYKRCVMLYRQVQCAGPTAYSIHLLRPIVWSTLFVRSKNERWTKKYAVNRMKNHKTDMKVCTVHAWPDEIQKKTKSNNTLDWLLAGTYMRSVCGNIESLL